MATAAAAVGAATASGVGVELFRYNRGNYRFDQLLRWFRFNAGRDFACAQMDQYREDVVDICNMTTMRMDQYNGIAGCILTLLVAISCAGRLGLHHPAPPSWLMGCMLTNLAASFMYLTLGIWIGIFASLRSHSAQTHMMTRYMRLPVPSMRMLDKARNLSSNFEKQPVRDILRVPWLSHGKESVPRSDLPDDYPSDDEEEHNPRTLYRKPTWAQAEKRIDRGGSYGAPSGDVPAHFDLLREIQHEWWPYDVYARVCTTYGYLCMLNGWVSFQICHAMVEDRAPFAAFSSCTLLITLQVLILRLDIVPTGGSSKSPSLELLGPIWSYFAYFACLLEYKNGFSQSAYDVAKALVIIQYFGMVLYHKRLLDLAAPTKEPQREAADMQVGKPWWPGSWQIPTSFSQVLYIVAPPKELKPGEADLVGELAKKAGYQPVSPSNSQKERKDRVHDILGRTGETQPWHLVRFATASLTFWWFLQFAGTIVEAIWGQGKLLNPPGADCWTRDPRWRPNKPGNNPENWGPPLPGYGRGFGWFPCPTVFAEECKKRGSWPIHERRLQENATFDGILASHAQALLPKLNGLRSKLAEQSSTTKEGVDTAHMAAHLSYRIAELEREMAAKGLQNALSSTRQLAPAVPAVIAWPPLLEPRVLACGPGAGFAAIAPRGLGVIVTADQNGASDSASFALQGLTELGPLAGASWDAQGLLVLSREGVIAECPGNGPTNKRWKCNVFDSRLPLLAGGSMAGGERLAAAAVTRTGAGFQAALVMAGKPTTVLLLRSASVGAPWVPAGEARLRTQTTSAIAAASFKGDSLLLTTEDGAVLQWQLSSHTPQIIIPKEAAHLEGTTWRSACGFATGTVARLAHEHKAGTSEWSPKVFMSALTGVKMQTL